MNKMISYSYHQKVAKKCALLYNLCMQKCDFQNSKVLVDEVLKQSAEELTEKVYLNDEAGHRQGPFIRKTFAENSGLGKVYQQLHVKKALCDTQFFSSTSRTIDFPTQSYKQAASSASKTAGLQVQNNYLPQIYYTGL